MGVQTESLYMWLLANGLRTTPCGERSRHGGAGALPLALSGALARPFMIDDEATLLKQK